MDRRKGGLDLITQGVRELQEDDPTTALAIVYLHIFTLFPGEMDASTETVQPVPVVPAVEKTLEPSAPHETKGINVHNSALEEMDIVQAATESKQCPGFRQPSQASPSRPPTPSGTISTKTTFKRPFSSTHVQSPRSPPLVLPSPRKPAPNAQTPSGTVQRMLSIPKDPKNRTPDARTSAQRSTSNQTNARLERLQEIFDSDSDDGMEIDE